MGNGPIQPPAQGAGGQLQNAPQAMPGPVPQGGPAAAQMQPDPTMTQIPGTPGEQSPDQESELRDYMDFAFHTTNLADRFQKKDPELLKTMASEVLQGYEADETSREPWMKRNDEWLKLALLVRENKSFPWPKASNVKYPLLATAAMQFTARAYPALVPSDGHLVKAKIVQQDPKDPIYAAARRISNHMSFQLLERIPDWEQDMDKLLMTMSISGICFKKTYHDKVSGCHRSHIVYPENFCINYNAKSLEKAYRKCEILRYTDNELKEKVLAKEFLDLDFSKPSQENSVDPKKFVVTGIQPPPVDKSTPHTFIAAHTFWDLDDDGYEEPYIITIHKETQQVVRIIARWCMEGVFRDEKDKKKIIRIDPVEYFTAFPFIPNPDGSIYALGFGLLLGPLNESVNSLINQLVDAGTLNNMQSGFIGKGLRLRMGQTSLQPGEFKVVNATGEDLQKSVFMMPTKEPSNVLFQLMNMLVTSGNQLASIAEIFVGKMPGQNTPATTTQETIQQGMAVFTAIYKRVYRSLGQEFRKLFWLNKICPDIVKEESIVSGMPLQASDYDLPEWSIIPGADPTGDSTTVRQAKLQTVGQLLSMGTIDPMAYTKMVLDANEIPNGQALMRQPTPPPPDPKLALLQEKGKQDAEAHQADMAGKQQDLQATASKSQIELAEMAGKVSHEQQMQALKLQSAEHGAKLDALSETIKNHFRTQEGNLKLAGAVAKHQQDVVHTEIGHRQEVVHNEVQHRHQLTMDAQKTRAATKAKKAAAPK